MSAAAAGEARLELVIGSRLDQVAALGHAVAGVCRGAGFDSVVTSEVELALVEVVNNAIRHAYGGSAEGEVRVGLHVSPERVVLEVSDRGRAMAGNVLADAQAPHFDPNVIAGLPESGLGLAIVKELMEDVRYESSDGRNVLHMARRNPRAVRG